MLGNRGTRWSRSNTCADALVQAGTAYKVAIECFALCIPEVLIFPTNPLSSSYRRPRCCVLPHNVGGPEKEQVEKRTEMS